MSSETNASSRAPRRPSPTAPRVQAVVLWRSSEWATANRRNADTSLAAAAHPWPCVARTLVEPTNRRHPVLGMLTPPWPHRRPPGYLRGRSFAALV